MPKQQNNLTQSDNSQQIQKKKFRLDDEAVRKIDSEFSDATDEFRAAGRLKKRPAPPRKRLGESNNGRPPAPRRKRPPAAARPQQKNVVSASNRPRRNGSLPNRDSRKYYGGDRYGEFEEEQEVSTPKKHRLRKIIIIVILLCVLVILINIGLLLFSGKIWFNEPRKRDYPIRGPIVSEEMGEINWDRFATQNNIQMAFIRATKSTTYVDKNFEENWAQSEGSGLPTGALHIFDTDIDGAEQAEHFYKTVGDISGRVIPAVEVKFTGIHKVIPADYDNVTKKLVDYTNKIYELYGVYPIIKCNNKVYQKVVKNTNNFSDNKTENFEGCPIWYESLYSKPDEDIKWDFWSYTDRYVISFYETKCYLNMAVFAKDSKEFDKYMYGAKGNNTEE